MNVLHDRLKKHEGLSLKPYIDSRGFLTIGYGRCLDTKGISRHEAEMLLEADIFHASDLFFTLPLKWIKRLNQNRRRVIVEMIFNMGLGGVKGFKKMWKAIEAEDFEAAADEMLDSAWRHQVGDRAVNLSMEMRHG